MGFQWLGGNPEMERLRQLEGACGDVQRELAEVRRSGAMGAAEYQELSRRLAAIAVWVRASQIGGGPQPPLEQPETTPATLEEPEAPGESGG